MTWLRKVAERVLALVRHERPADPDLPAAQAEAVRMTRRVDRILRADAVEVDRRIRGFR